METPTPVCIIVFFARVPGYYFLTLGCFLNGYSIIYSYFGKNMRFLFKEPFIHANVFWTYAHLSNNYMRLFFFIFSLGLQDCNARILLPQFCFLKPSYLLRLKSLQMISGPSHKKKKRYNLTEGFHLCVLTRWQKDRLCEKLESVETLQRLLPSKGNLELASVSTTLGRSSLLPF